MAHFAASAIAGFSKSFARTRSIDIVSLPCWLSSRCTSCAHAYVLSPVAASFTQLPSTLSSHCNCWRSSVPHVGPLGWAAV